MTTPLDPTIPGAHGICDDWPVEYPCDTSSIPASGLEMATQLATEIVWALSGRQFGTCIVTLRPCRRECVDPWPINWEPFVWPALIGGKWFNIICGQCGDTCSCTQLHEVDLPGYVHEVLEVKVDGTPLVTGAYRVDNNRFLVRTDGNPWPFCNDLNEDDTEVDTWSVTAKFGKPVPYGGAWAVGELACELTKAFGGEDCRIPRNITQLVRQGVTIQYPDITEAFKSGMTGLYLVDLFLATFNPAGLKNRSRTYNVDEVMARRTNT